MEGCRAGLAAQQAPSCKGGGSAWCVLLPDSKPRASPAHPGGHGPATQGVGSPAGCAPSRGRPSLTFGAHEAPAHVDVGVVPLPLPRGEVGRADDAVGRDHQAAGRQAGVPAVVGDGAAHAPHHFPWGQTPRRAVSSRETACPHPPKHTATTGVKPPGLEGRRVKKHVLESAGGQGPHVKHCTAALAGGSVVRTSAQGLKGRTLRASSWAQHCCVCPQRSACPQRTRHGPGPWGGRQPRCHTHGRSQRCLHAGTQLLRGNHHSRKRQCLRERLPAPLYSRRPARWQLGRAEGGGRGQTQPVWDSNRKSDSK